MKDEKEIESLLSDLKHVSPDKRKMACLTLGKAKSARAVDLLISALNDTDMMVRECAAEALGEIGDPKAVEPLANALKDKELLRPTRSRDGARTNRRCASVGTPYRGYERR